MNKSLHRLFRFASGKQWWLMRRFTPSGLAVLICLPIAAAAGMDTNESVAYQIFTLLLAMLGIAIATSLSFRDRFTVTRILPRFGTVGVPLTYRVVLHNHTRKLQTSLKLLENLADPRPSFAEFISTP